MSGSDHPRDFEGRYLGTGLTMDDDNLSNNVNETHTEMDRPPPYDPAAQYPQGPQVTSINVTGTQEVFAREERFAEWVRFWWCRPIGWLAKAELVKARTLHAAGDYEAAQSAARRANVWSTVGLISGILLVAAIGVATYLIIVYST